MTVRMTTHLNARGGGTFSIAIAADKELHDQLLAAPDASSGFASVQGLFDGLQARGWDVAKSEPSGGLSFAASKKFNNGAEFDSLLSDIRTARGNGAGSFGGIRFDLGYETRRAFARTQTRFHGDFDTSGLKLDPEVLRAIQGLVRFEIRAELPGTTTVSDAIGAVAGQTAVWRPELGSSFAFSAGSSALRVGSLLLILIPGLGLLGFVAWFALGRRKPDDDLRAIVADERAPVRVATSTFISFHPEPLDHVVKLDAEPIVLDPEPIKLDSPTDIEEPRA